MLTRQRTYVATVVDASGSMARLRQATMEGYDAYLATLRETPATSRVSLITFNSTVTEVYTGKLVMEAEGLDHRYATVGGTALYDAIFTAVGALDALQEQQDRFIVAVLTDGEDNESQRSLTEVKRLITERQATGRWTFIFLGTNILLGKKMGFMTTLKLTASADGVREALAGVAEETQRLLLSAGPTIYSS